jgi:hypothetical protein
MLGLSCANTADLPPIGTATATGTRLFVELVVNGQAKAEVVSMHLRDGHLIVAASDLLANGIPANYRNQY